MSWVHPKKVPTSSKLLYLRISESELVHKEIYTSLAISKFFFSIDTAVIGASVAWMKIGADETCPNSHLVLQA